MRLILLFLAFVFSAVAQDFYVDTPVSTSQVTGTSVYTSGLTVSGSATVRGGPLGVSGTTSTTALLVGRSLSETTPDMAFGRDTNTGIGSLGNETLNLITNGSTRLSVQQTRVGVLTGSSVTSASFQVSGSAMVNGNLVAACGNTSSSVAGMEVCGGVSASGVISATRFAGDGSGLTGIVTGGPVPWVSVTDVPVPLIAVSNSGSVSFTSLRVSDSASIANLSATIVTAGENLAKSLADSVSNFGATIYLSQTGVICDGQKHAENLPLTYEAYARAPLYAGGLRVVHCANARFGTDRALGAVTYVTLTNPGIGYTSTPTAIISDSATTSGTTCVGQVVGVTLSGTQIGSVSMTTVGSGCNKDNPQVLFSGGGGSGASAKAYIERPIRVASSTIADLSAGEQIHDFNSSEQFFIEGVNFDDNATARQRYIVYDFGNKGLIRFATSSIGQGKKGLGNTNTDQAVSINERTSGTTIDSFTSQCRNCSYYLRLNPNLDAGNSQGEDGFHVTGESHYVYTVAGTQRGGDDGSSGTQETDGHDGKHISNVYFIGGVISTYNNSSAKLFCGNNADADSGISDWWYIGTTLQIHGNGTTGGLVKFDAETCPITNVGFAGHSILDGTNGEGAGASSSPAIQLISSKPCLLNNVNFGDSEFRDFNYRGFAWDGNTCNVFWKGGTIGPYGGVSVTAAGLNVASMVRQSANTVRITFSGSPTLPTDTAHSYVSVTSMANPYNNATVNITAVSTTGFYVDGTMTGISTTYNETGSNGRATIYQANGPSVYGRGGYNIFLDGMTYNGSAEGTVNLLTDSGPNYTAIGVSYTAPNRALLQLSGNPDLSVVSPYTSWVEMTAWANSANNGLFKIMEVNDASNTLTLLRSGITSATDEISTTGIVADTSYYPTNVNLTNSTCINQERDSCISISAGMDTVVDHIHCVDSLGDKCITESSTQDVSGTAGTFNLSDGARNKVRDHFTWNDADHRAIYMNFGYGEFANEADWYSLVTQTGIRTNGLSATTVLVTGTTTTNALSAVGVSTTGVSVTANATIGGNAAIAGSVSVTANVSVTGNVSANKFIGDGSLLTSVPATASSVGPVGTVQIAGPASTTIAASGTVFTSNTQDWAFPSNITAVGVVSSTRSMATSAGSNSSASVQVQSANIGLYRAQAGCLSTTSAGTETMRLCATAVSITAPLTVSGTISATALNVSQTSVPCASAADIGNIRYTSTYQAFARCESALVFRAISASSVTFSPTVP